MKLFKYSLINSSPGGLYAKKIGIVFADTEEEATIIIKRRYPERLHTPYDTRSTVYVLKLTEISTSGLTELVEV